MYNLPMENELKTIAITGSTGGIGREIAFELAKLGKNLIFVDRNLKKTEALKEDIKRIYPQTDIKYVLNDLSDFALVKKAVEQLRNMEFDALILNAGIYNTKLESLDSGYNNIFQTNFLYQYYLARKLVEAKKIKKIVVTGSIAYKMSKLNKNDIDYSACKSQNKIYSNSKKFLMISLIDLCKKTGTRLSIAHPGITLTSLTAHFPKSINWFVKGFMKLFFISPKKASKNIVYGLLNDYSFDEWVGPKVFDIWGKPKIKKLKFIKTEKEKIPMLANKMFDELCEK